MYRSSIGGAVTADPSPGEGSRSSSPMTVLTSGCPVAVWWQLFRVCRDELAFIRQLHHGWKHRSPVNNKLVDGVLGLVGGEPLRNSTPTQPVTCHRRCRLPLHGGLRSNHKQASRGSANALATEQQTYTCWAERTLHTQRGRSRASGKPSRECRGRKLRIEKIGNQEIQAPGMLNRKVEYRKRGRTKAVREVRFVFVSIWDHFGISLESITASFGSSVEYQVWEG